MDMMISRNNNRELSASELRELKILRNRRRRQRQLRRRMVIAACALIIVLSSAFGLTSFLSRASEPGTDSTAKVYTSVMIPYGASLGSLASEYINYDHYESLDSYINEIRYINHLNDDRVIAGHYLIMPYYTEF